MSQSSQPKNSLDSLMLACADLSATSQNSFKGPPLKDLRVQKKEAPKFQPSANARDWSSLSQNLEDAFSVPNAADGGRGGGQGSSVSKIGGVVDDWGDFQLPTNSQPVVPTPPVVASHSLAGPSVAAGRDDDDFADFISAAAAAPVTNSIAAALPRPPQQTNSFFKPSGHEPVVQVAKPRKPLLLPVLFAVNAVDKKKSVPGQDLSTISNHWGINDVQFDSVVNSLPEVRPGQANVDNLSSSKREPALLPSQPQADFLSPLKLATDASPSLSSGQDKYANLRVYFDEDQPTISSSTSMPINPCDDTSISNVEDEFGDFIEPTGNEPLAVESMMPNIPVMPMMFPSPHASFIKPGQKSEEGFALDTKNVLDSPLEFELSSSFSISGVKQDSFPRIDARLFDLPLNPVTSRDPPMISESIFDLETFGQTSFGSKPAMETVSNVLLFSTPESTEHKSSDSRDSDIASEVPKPTLSFSTPSSSLPPSIVPWHLETPPQLLTEEDAEEDEKADTDISGLDTFTIMEKSSTAAAATKSLDSLSVCSNSELSSGGGGGSKRRGSAHSLHLSEEDFSIGEIGNDLPATAYWTKAMEAILKLFSEADKSIRTISDFAVLNEIFDSPQGSSYLSNLKEIHRVSLRIKHSLGSQGNTDSLKELAENIDKTWRSFLCHARCPDRVSKTSYSGGDCADSSRCGLCLVDLAVPGEEGMNDKTLAVDSDRLLLGSRSSSEGIKYHAACANFWVNFVDDYLPVVNGSTLPGK